MSYILTFLTLTVALSGAALLIALDAAKRSRQALVTKRFPWQQLESLELQLSDLTERHCSLLASFKRLQSRVGMREARKALKEGSGNQTDDDQMELPEPVAISPEERDKLKRMLVNMR